MDVVLVATVTHECNVFSAEISALQRRSCVRRGMPALRGNDRLVNVKYDPGKTNYIHSHSYDPDFSLSRRISVIAF